MSQSRLSLLFEADPLPEGRVVVFRPPMDHDLSALAADSLDIVQGFRPDHDAWTARGFRVDVAPPAAFDIGIVVLPRAKAEAQGLIATAAQAQRIVIDGLKGHGVESILKALRQRGAVSSVVSKAHGKAFWVTLPPRALADWEPKPCVVGAWHTAPGLFSADGPDPGSLALAESLPAALPGRVADLGAGWGFLAHAALARSGVTEVALVEAEHAALAAARINITDPRARFHWADARTWADAGRFDHVVMNPPFHTGRAADPALGRAFIAAAARILGPHGTLWIVANRHLPYEAALTEAFREVTPLPGPPAFKLYRAGKPVRPRHAR